MINLQIQTNIKYLFTAFLMLICNVMQAQGVYFYDAKKGLSNSQIQTMYEDSRHNIWITTRNGLNRYDGAKINTYRHSDTDPTSLKNDITTCVFEYDEDHIIIGSDAGLQSYSHSTNKFTDVPYIGERGDTILMHVISMIRFKSGKVYACIAAEGLVEIQKDAQGHLMGKRSMDYQTGDNVSPIRLYEDHEGNIWIINRRGDLYVKNGKKVQQIEDISYARKLCESSSGKLYLCTNFGTLLVYSKESKTFKPVNDQTANYTIWSISPWTNERIFICTDGNGVKVYDEHTGIISQSPIQVSDFNLSTSNVKDVICDSFGSVWVGIYWKGVMQKPMSQSAFEYIGRQSITKNTIGTNSVTAIVPDGKGKLWVATDHCGLYHMEADGSDSQNWDAETTPNMPSTINALCADSKRGRVWLGSYASGLFYMDENTGHVTPIGKNIKNVFDIQHDANGHLWIASMGSGLFYYDPSTGNTVNYVTTSTSSADRSVALLDNMYISCIQIKNNKMYIGSSNGLDIYNITSNSVLKHENRILLSKFINDMVLDGNTLWVAAIQGLYSIDITTMTTTHYGVQEGLPNNVVNSIELEGNNVWLGTDNGLACFEKNTKQFHNFFVDDGLQDNEFGIRTSAKIGKTLYFGGISGLNYFTKEAILGHSSNIAIRMRIVDLYVNSQPIYAGDKSGYYTIIDNEINKVKTIHLSHNDNNFTLELATLGLGYLHSVYEYSLDGGDWIVQSEQSNNIIFANMKRGTHTLKLRAKTYQSVSEEHELTIVVHQPWYLSPIAWFLYFILLVGIVWMAYNQAARLLAARRILENHRKEEEMNEARIQFFMNISHEIRTPMTLIFAPLEKLMGSDKDDERQRNYKLIHQNSKRIMRLINQMMDARKIEKGQYKLDFRPMELVDFTQSIYDVFVTSAQNRNITFEFNHPDTKVYAKADPENLDKILMNLLSNAFKFTPDCGKISLDLIIEDERIIYKVTDSGTGIPDSEKTKVFERFYSGQHQNGYIGTGIGLNLTYLIVKMHNGDITVGDNPEGRGTQFVVDIPFIDVMESDVENMESKIIEEAKPAHQEEGVTLPVEKLKGMRHRNVMVVEDDAAIRAYIHSELSSDMIITEFCNGQEGWDYLIQNPTKVDLIISDIMMPGMDGLTLCQKIKQNFNTNHLPVILTTALGTDTDRIKGIDIGADAYVTKPFNIDVLRSTAINLLNSRLALQGKWASSQKTEENIEKREIESADEHLLNRVIKVIDENMEDPELSIEIIADKVGISRVHFYRKMKELTGQSPRDFLKTVRLKEAARLLSEKRLDITSVCAATGFKTLSTFSTSFKGVYGVSPSEYANRERKQE